MFKFLIITCALLPAFSLVSGQVNDEVFLVTRSKTHLHYIQLDNRGGEIFEMGRHMDKGGGGYSILSRETLKKESGGSPDLYAGNSSKIIRENGKLYLITASDTRNRRSRYRLDTASNISAVYRNLNNGYYLDQFFSMSRGYDNTAPLTLSSFTRGLITWDALDNKEIHPAEFRLFTDARLIAVRDSVRNRQNQDALLTQLLLERISTIHFDSLANGLIVLSSNFKTRSGHFTEVLREAAKQRPAYFFKLAENYPLHKSMIFASVQDDKVAMETLKSYQTDVSTKKELFKMVKYERTIPYRVIGTYAVVIGVITFLLARD